eukprot:TRINITY_DN23450_c0_g1_i2.p1 TRINITY_DN23450_c0_g1~~TRINITY_DN23450_c0_g1_i2.p1  ORF type:complete len:223 (-),score=-3.14 TRINITY_DN23450_c0_g1_i2:15-683(-)
MLYPMADPTTRHASALSLEHHLTFRSQRAATQFVQPFFLDTSHQADDWKSHCSVSRQLLVLRCLAGLAHIVVFLWLVPMTPVITSCRLKFKHLQNGSLTVNSMENTTTSQHLQSFPTSFLFTLKRTSQRLTNHLVPDRSLQSYLLEPVCGTPVYLSLLYPMYSALIPVSYTHLTLPTICSVQISVVAVSLKKKKKKQRKKNQPKIDMKCSGIKRRQDRKQEK